MTLIRILCAYNSMFSIVCIYHKLVVLGLIVKMISFQFCETWDDSSRPNNRAIIWNDSFAVAYCDTDQLNLSEILIGFSLDATCNKVGETREWNCKRRTCIEKAMNTRYRDKSDLPAIISVIHSLPNNCWKVSFGSVIKRYGTIASVCDSHGHSDNIIGRVWPRTGRIYWESLN